MATAHDLAVDRVVTAVGSALNGQRRKLLALVADPEVTTIVVEHRDRSPSRPGPTNRTLHCCACQPRTPSGCARSFSPGGGAFACRRAAGRFSGGCRVQT